MSWDKGRATINELVAAAHLERVPANADEAQYLLGVAARHLITARDLATDDPEIAYDALYAAARKALTAVLIQQGLRPTRAGGHEAVIQAALAQFVPPLGDVLKPYRRLRRQRAQGDYLASEGAISSEDVNADLPASTAIVDAATRVAPSLPVFTG
jgi:hypothetical protein